MVEQVVLFGEGQFLVGVGRIVGELPREDPHPSKLAGSQRHPPHPKHICNKNPSRFPSYLAFTTFFTLVGIETSPKNSKAHHGGILHGPGQREGAQQLEVVLHEVRVLLLREVVVVGLVVFHIPGLWQHPVQPCCGHCSRGGGRIANKSISNSDIVTICNYNNSSSYNNNSNNTLERERDIHR